MSIYHIAAVAELNGLPPARKTILFLVAIEANSMGSAPFERDRLRNKSNLSERSFRDHLKRLFDDGLLIPEISTGMVRLSLARMRGQ